MTEAECLERMVAPGTRRPGKYREGVIQIHLTRACDKACHNCTQGSEFGGRLEFMPVEMFKVAVESLRGYFGVVGVFGGNPAMHPEFLEICHALRESWVPFEQRGLWCNNPLTQQKAEAMRLTFNPAVSNLNVHLDQEAARLFDLHWPEAHLVGRILDSRHAPVFVAMKDVLRKECSECKGRGRIWNNASNEPEDGVLNIACTNCSTTGRMYDEARAWELISGCDINQHWSAMVGMFRGELRAWFCEVAGAQAMLHQHDEGYPDTGVPIESDGLSTLERWKDGIIGWGRWWKQSMQLFANQVHKHCHECGVPLRGYGSLSQEQQERGGCTQVSQTHIFKPKRKIPLDVVTTLGHMQLNRLGRRGVIDYLGNAKL